jgi:polyhydroxyalkanoate synthesis regulator phasin
MGVEGFEDKVKQEVEDRGGTDALKEDATEVKDDVTEQGSLSDKAKDVVEDVKDPGAPGN